MDKISCTRNPRRGFVGCMEDLKTIQLEVEVVVDVEGPALIRLGDGFLPWRFLDVS